MKAMFSAWLWAAVFGVGGASLVVAGVEILAGRGWSFIASGCFLLVLFGVLMKGLSRG